MIHNRTQGHLGITAPIQLDESSQEEKEATTTLMEELHRQRTFESELEAKTRCVCLFVSAANVAVTAMPSPSTLYRAPLSELGVWPVVVAL